MHVAVHYGPHTPCSMYSPCVSFSLYVWSSFFFRQVNLVSGCDDFYPVTVRCPTVGNVPITIRGVNFGTSGAQVTFAGGGLQAECTNVIHDPGAQDSVLECRSYRPLFNTASDVLTGASAQTLRVTITTLTGLSLTHAFMGMAFAKQPIITEVLGCTSSVGPMHTADCFTDGRLPITVRGHNFLGFDVMLRIAGVACDKGSQMVVNRSAEQRKGQGQ